MRFQNNKIHGLSMKSYCNQTHITGGSAHTDANGIKYQKDLSAVGTSSDHGKRYLIARVNSNDQPLYQTERYHFADFTVGYGSNKG